MLTPTQALRVVKWCVKEISGESPDVGDRLRDVGIPSKDHIQLLIDMIVMSEENGVPAFGHEIDPAALHQVKSTWTITDVADIVQQQAEPV